MADSNKTKNDLGTEALRSLESTVGTFAHRIKRRMREQEQAENTTQKEADLRQSRILLAMNSIRKGLQETSKVALGSRFALELRVDDFEGWPRLELDLLDNLIPEKIEHALVITAHDRKQRGLITISLKSGQVLGRFELADPAEMNRIPLVLKKAVRAFLDAVADYVLHPVDPAETLKVQTEAIALNDGTQDPSTERLQHEDVFSEDLQPETNNMVATDQNTAPVVEVDLVKDQH
jgi:hypothetical protein